MARSWLTTAAIGAGLVIVMSASGPPRPAAGRAAGPAPTVSTTLPPAVTVSPVTDAPPTTAPALSTAVPPRTAAATSALSTRRPTTTSLAPGSGTVAPSPVAGGLAIGDSVLEDVQLYAASTLASHGIAINAAVGRQWGSGEAMFASLRAAGRLPGVVVVALGTHGRVGPADFDAMMAAVAGARRAVFMTVTGPYAANNSVIVAGVARYPQAALADWAALSAAHPGWFAPDR